MEKSKSYKGVFHFLSVQTKDNVYFWGDPLSATFTNK